jgi:hypothetical protein
MFDALLANLKSGALEGAWNARLSDQLAEAAARSLNDSALRRQLLQALLQAVASADAEEYDLSPALCTAFGIACSNMGAEVAVTGQRQIVTGAAAERWLAGEPRLPPCSCAVLVCGFAGASLSMLSPIEAMWRRLWPDARVVVSTQSGLDDVHAVPAMRAQLDEIEAALEGCGRVLVHAQSINGWRLWIELLHACPALARRVCGVVYDCGPALGGALCESKAGMA